MPLSSRRCRPHTTQRTGLQQYKSTNRGPSRGRRARCTADMLHTSTENVNTSLDDPKSVTSHVSNVGFYRKIKKSKKKDYIYSTGLTTQSTTINFHLSRSDLSLMIMFQAYYYYCSSSGHLARGDFSPRHIALHPCHSEEITLTYVWEPVERGHCTNCMTGSPVLYLLESYPVSLSSPDAVFCCSYFINVLLTIIGMKAAKLHIINCNKWRASGYIYCSTVALLQLWNWFRNKSLHRGAENTCEFSV